MSKYDEIINIPHFEPKHPRMRLEVRAAEFAPFSALTGYSDEIKETARITSKEIIIDDNLKVILDRKLNFIQNNIGKNYDVIFTYFVKDNYKDGGKYIDKLGIVKKIDLNEKVVILSDKTKIPINNIIDIYISDINID